MTNPIETTFTSGATLYAVVHHTDGRVWNDSLQAWEAFDDSKWAQYTIPLTEQGHSGYYRANFPSGASGDFLTTEVVYQQAGGTPATIDAPATGIGQSQGVDVAAISKSVTAAARLALSLGLMKTGSVTSSGTSTVSKIYTDLDDTADNVYQGRLISFTSGALICQMANIASYNAAEHSITVAGAFTEAPGIADTFIIV